MGRLTTHVLDTAYGVPASAMQIRLFLVTGSEKTLLKETLTNNDGRCDGPLLDGDLFKAGTYELVFFVGKYFDKKSSLPNPPFLDEVPIRFSIADGKSHYHVPLLVSPWAYSTYRGS